MRPILFLMATALLLGGCMDRRTEKEPAATAKPPIVGADRDAHGCIGSAGYRWCAREQACVRSWELAEQKGFARDQVGFDGYCAKAAP